MVNQRLLPDDLPRPPEDDPLYARFVNQRVLVVGNGPTSKLLKPSDVDRWPVVCCNYGAQRLPCDAVFATDDTPTVDLITNHLWRAKFLIMWKKRWCEKKSKLAVEHGVLPFIRLEKRQGGGSGTFAFFSTLGKKPSGMVMVGFDGDHPDPNCEGSKKREQAKYDGWHEVMFRCWQNAEEPRPKLWRVIVDGCRPSPLDRIAERISPDQIAGIMNG